MTSYVEMYQEDPGKKNRPPGAILDLPGSVTGKIPDRQGDFNFTRVNNLLVDGWIEPSNGRRTDNVADDMTSSDVTLKRRQTNRQLRSQIYPGKHLEFLRRLLRRFNHLDACPIHPG